MAVAKLHNQSKTWYPRLQSNKRGEIVLATGKEGILTRGILVGKTPGSTSTAPIGQYIEDWEVCGLLTDYDGAVSVKFSNEHKVKNDSL